MSPHHILGLAADASPSDIKRAYRRLAMAWHPDRNDHPQATERFKEIRAAYDALMRPAEAGEPSPPEETPSASPGKAADIRLDLELALEEAALGVTRTITLTRGSPCTTCEGTGEAGLQRTRMCGHCHGSGRVRRRGHGLEPCPDCGGRGFFSERICPDCGGLGRDEEDIDLAVTVPPGMLTGDELRLAGQGEAAREELAAGDLYLTLRLRPHPLFRLEGRNLCYTMPLSALTLLAGGTVSLPTLGGEVEAELAAGEPQTRRLILPGRGYPGRAGSLAGDLVVDLQPVFPAHLSEKEKKLLREADCLLAKHLEDSLPEVAAWRKRFVPDSGN